MAVAKTIELISGSPDGIEQAVEAGLAKAAETITNIEGAWVKDTKVVVKNGAAAEWRVTLVITFIVQ